MIENYREHQDDFRSAADRLYTIITILRSPEGCPWDRVQTSKSAAEALIDETYEYLDGVQKKSIGSEREEIGDILINVFMALYIHEENRDFTPAEAINEVCDKLIRRHPHVFGNADRTGTPEEVLNIWNSVKENVEGHRNEGENLFSHIPSLLPPLEMSYEIQKKLKKSGFDWDSADGVIDKIYEELDEVKQAIASEDKDSVEEEIGDLLFSAVNLARFLKVRPNTALHRTNEKVKERFLSVVRIAGEEGIPVDKEHAAELNEIWDRIKD